MPEKRYSKNIVANKIVREINVYVGDMTKTDRHYDLILCSAFKGTYTTYRPSLIKSLAASGISVQKLSENPEKNGKDFGFWVSKKQDSFFFDRICCFEFEHARFYEGGMSFRAVFDYFITMLTYDTQFNFKNIATTLLGTNNIGLSKKQIIPVLLQTALQCFLSSHFLKEFSIYCLEEEEAKMVNDALINILNKPYDIFISYPHEREADMAIIREEMKKKHIKVWTDQRIKVGDEFDDVIANAINQSKAFLLIWSKETEESSYCAIELGYALDLNKRIIPIRCSNELDGNTKIGNKIGRRSWFDFDRCSLNQLIKNIKSALRDIKTIDQEGIVEI